ncbi:MAG: hypothetical protein D6731_04470 [Planctomycetota bacterium]|nr:MAG: hypothetical protein D6731_04470 [Planctomycetota bacterium]
MAWKPISGLAPSAREELTRRILRGEVPSYVDERGERRVWMAGDLPPFWALDLVARVRQEVADLRRSLEASGRSARPTRARRAA